MHSQLAWKKEYSLFYIGDSTDITRNNRRHLVVGFGELNAFHRCEPLERSMRRLLTALALVVGADAKASLYCPDSEASNYKAPADRPLRGERASPHCARRGLMNRTTRGGASQAGAGAGARERGQA